MLVINVVLVVAVEMVVIEYLNAFFKKSFHKQKNGVHLQPLPRESFGQQVGAIAQLVEQRTENPCVAGSIPAGTTEKSKAFSRKTEGFFVSEIYTLAFTFTA